MSRRRAPPEPRRGVLIQLIEVPYDSGHQGTRLGRGPGHLLQGGLADRLRAAGHRVEVIHVEARTRFPTEVATTFEVARLLARQVRMAANQKRFPLVLAGNCASCLGTLGGLGAGVGVVWFDAHADLNTPETTRSGFVDGMALATAAGLCWRGMAESVPGLRPVPPEHILLVGARDLDAAEAQLLERSGVARVGPARLRAEGVREALGPALDALRRRVERVYLHLDLDVLDPDAVGAANGYAAPGGLSVEELRAALAMIRERFRVGAAALTAYDPALDPEGRVRAAALRVVEALTAEPPPA